VATAVLACAATRARAEPLPVTLSVSRTAAAQGCPDEVGLGALVEATARRPRVDAQAVPGIAAEVGFDRSEERFRAMVRLSGAKTGERELTDTGPDCAPLAQAVAITLVLLADHGPDTVAAPLPTAPRETPAPSAWRAARVSLVGGAGLGLVGPASLDVSVGFSAERRSGWGLAGDVFLVAPQRTALPPGDVRVWLLAVEVGLCRAALDGPHMLVRVCAGGAAGWLDGRAFGYPTSQSNGFPWFAASARLGLGGPIAGRLRWIGQAELLVPLRRQTFSIDNLGVVWESRPVGGRLDLGAEVSWW
jgi:hypothetical protein